MRVTIYLNLASGNRKKNGVFIQKEIHPIILLEINLLIKLNLGIHWWFAECLRNLKFSYSNPCLSFTLMFKKSQSQKLWRRKYSWQALSDVRSPLKVINVEKLQLVVLSNHQQLSITMEVIIYGIAQVFFPI